MTAAEPVLPYLHDPIPGPHDVSLRPIADRDVPDLFRWRNDPEVVEFWGTPPATEDDVRKEDFAPYEGSPTWRFIIELEGRGVGFLQYYYPEAGEDHTWDAGIDIYIGAPDARNRGIGTEAVRVMLAYLFEVKRVHRVTIDPQTDNARAIRAYEKAGFRRDGVLRHNARINGHYVDTQMLSILEDEWPAARGRWMQERST